MERINLEAQLREEKGKQLVKRVRAAGFIPAVVYKGGKDSLSLKVSQKDFVKVIGTKAGANVIITLKISDKKESSKAQKDRTVMVKEIQKNPVKGGIIHIDFNEISLTETLKVQVRVEPKGEAAGVKEGGTLERVMREVDVECLPTAIPEKLEIDISALKIGDSVFVKDIVVPADVKILQDPSLIVMSVKPPFVEKVAEVAVEAAPEEPELIRKKKEAEEEEGEGKEAPAKEEGKKEAAAPKKEAPTKEEKK